MSSSEDISKLYEIVGIEKIPLDDVIPDSKPHLIILMLDFFPHILPVVILGSNWDMLWWIYRLSEYGNMDWEEFVHSYLRDVRKN